LKFGMSTSPTPRGCRTSDATAAAPRQHSDFAAREYQHYLADQMRPLIGALMIGALLVYVICVAAIIMLHATHQLPLWLRMAPLGPLLLLALVTPHTRRPWVLSTLTLACVVLLEVGINLNGVGHIEGAAWITPGLLLPVVCSMVWLARWDFLLAMALCALGPLPILLLGSSSSVEVVQYSVYMVISVMMATVLRTFMARILREQFRLEQRLRAQAHTDGLTGLLLRNRFLELAQNALDDARNSHQPLCVAFLDADHFKPINDNYGHAAGDAVLVGLSAALNQQMRKHDLIGRIGGEEFAVLLPGMDLERAIVRGELLRLAAHAVPRPDGRLTISIGLAQYLPDQDDIATMMARADQAMRNAKRGGRDRVVIN
jgi:diguanylate cyclase (GGDEF)-like protein